MTPRDLNTKLITSFPELAKSYNEETEWQEGDDTGSHIVYGDVLVPVILMLIESGDYNLVNKYFDYLEELLVLNDEYSTDVVATSVIESIFFDSVDKSGVKQLLGEKCLGIWEDFENSEE